MRGVAMVDLSGFLEITLATPDDFLKVKETLTRIGIPSRNAKILFQSCHILHKRERYFIVHFKEMFALEGKPSSLTESDLQRRNAIGKLLQDWNLVKLVNPLQIAGALSPLQAIKIIPFREKGEWQLVPKYTIGKKWPFTSEGPN